jgi:hypothetical protein
MEAQYQFTNVDVRAETREQAPIVSDPPMSSA